VTYTVPGNVRLARHVGDLDDDGHDTLGGGGGGSALEVLDEGVSLDTAVVSIDVVGAGIVATNVSHAVTLGLDSDLNTIAGLSPSNDDIMQLKAGAWTNRTMAQLKTDLAIKAAIPIVIGDGSTAMATGSKGFIEVPFACTILSNRLQADVAGDIVVDVKKATYAGLPTTSSICASAKPTIVATNQKSEDTTLTGWTTSITAGDWLEFNVDSVTTIKRVTLSIVVVRT